MPVWLSGSWFGMAVWLLGASAQAQGTIEGVVVIAGSLRPVPGAQVAVEGQPGRGAVADATGRFRLAGLAGTRVVLNTRALGYQARTDTLAVGTTDARIALTAIPSTLSQVVITGTPGGQARRELGSAVATVNLTDQVGNVAAVSLGQQLAARAPSVNITPASGQAGAGQRIQLRGRTSLTLRTQPLLIVDGVRTSAAGALNDFEAYQLENVEVVNGPSAGTLYGTDAGAGVIQLRTKRGRPGPPRLNVYLRSGFSEFNDYVDRLPVNRFFNPDGSVGTFHLPQVEKDRGTPLFSTAFNQGYAMDVSGGTETSQYYVAGHVNDDQGVIPKNSNRVYGGRVSHSITAHPKWDAESQFGFNLVRTKLPYGNYLANAVLSNPSQRNAPSRGFLFGVPNDVASRVNDNATDSDRLTAGGELRYRMFPWLSQRLRAGVDISNAKATTLTRRMTPADAAFFTPVAAAGTESVTNTDIMSTTVDYSATATRDLSSAARLTATAGGQYFRSFTQTLNANGRTFPTPDVTTLAGAATTFGTNNFTEEITAGMYGQVQLGVRERLFLTAALRADGASNFGRNFGLAKYPKVSASWVLSEESFFKVPHVDEFRLRSAFGVAGQQPVAFAALRTFTPVTGPGGAAAVSPNLIGNEDLGPERAREFEAGFDAALFGRRLTLNATYYNQRTSDVIVRRDVAPSSGFPAQQFVNAGEMQNIGWELQANYVPIDRDRLRWELGGWFSSNTNEVTAIDIPGVPFIQFGVGSRFQPGFPAYGMFARQIIRADRGPNNTATNVLCDGGVNGRPGGAPVACATAPRLFQGRVDPKVMGQANTSLRLWNRLTLSTLADWRTNYIKFVDFLYCGGGLGMGGGCQSRWYPERYDPITIAYNSFNSVDMAAWYADAAFLRWREASVNYAMPATWARAIGAKGASLTVAGRNLATWFAAGKGASIDPESTTIPDGGTGQAIETYPVPQLRFVTLLVNLRY